VLPSTHGRTKAVKEFDSFEEAVEHTDNLGLK
jgi:hypothetical protein